MRGAVSGATTLVLTLAALIWAVRRRIAVVTIVGPSMRPTYHTGDRVLVRRAGLSELRPGQVVVIEHPAADGAWVTPLPRWPGSSREWMIKRVAALPGDTLADLSLPLAQPRLAAGTVVPPGRLIVLGDNPAGSFDSRHFGYCPAGRLLGIVLRPLSPAARSSAGLTACCGLTGSTRRSAAWRRPATRTAAWRGPAIP